MQWRQFLSAHRCNHPKLIIGNHLEQRLSQQTQALDLLRRRAAMLGLVILPHGVDSLLNQRLAGLNHPYKGALVHFPAPIT